MPRRLLLLASIYNKENTRISPTSRPRKRRRRNRKNNKVVSVFSIKPSKEAIRTILKVYPIEYIAGKYGVSVDTLKEWAN